MNLECSSRGDKRFSALFAQITVNGVNNTIENHYQLSKRFGDFIPKDWREAKGKKPTHFMIGERDFGLNYLSDWYEALWLKYFLVNTDLLSVINKYDTFTDMFSKRGNNSQSDVIQKIHDKGLKYCIENNPLLILLKS